MVRPDRRARPVVDRMLGWRLGDRLTVTAVGRAHPGDADGMVTMPVKPYVVIRPRCVAAAGYGWCSGYAGRIPG